MKKAILVGCALLLSGCVTGPKYTQGYDAGIWPTEQVALIKPTGAVSLLSVDSTFIGARGIGELGHIEHEVSILPGRRVISVSYDDGSRYIPVPLKLSFVAEPGHKYIINHNIKMSESHFRPTVQDVTARPDCWTVKVGIFLGPKC